MSSNLSKPKFVLKIVRNEPFDFKLENFAVTCKPHSFPHLKPSHSRRQKSGERILPRHSIVEQSLLWLSVCIGKTLDFFIIEMCFAFVIVTKFILISI